MSKPNDKIEDKQYPVKSLHDFLFELGKEWSKFRNGALISLISSSIMFLIVLGVLLRVRRLSLGPADFILLVLAGVFLAYSIYAMYAQYRFFSRWERRVDLLLKTEQDLLTEKLDDKKPPVSQ
jgi:hypothetical protein